VTITDARCEDARAAARGGLGARPCRPARAWQRHGARPTSKCHHEWRCVRRPTLDAGVGRGDATSQSLWATRESLPAGDHRRGHHLPCPTLPFNRTPEPAGGDRWVAHTGIEGPRRAGHLRPSCGTGWPERRRAVVVTQTRGGQGRGAGRSAARSASSRSHRASSCCRRIHSASTIDAASSSTLVAHWVLVATSLTPFPECCAPGPAVRRAVVRR
jgi:hypothetical protein